MDAQARKMGSGSTVRYNLAWQTASNLGVAGIGGGYLLFLGRSLGAEEFGLYALVTGIATFAFAASDLRVHEATVRYASDWRNAPTDAGRSIIGLLVLDSICRFMIWIALATAGPMLARWLIHDSSAAGLLFIASTGVFLSKLGNNSALGALRAFGRFDWQGGILLSAWLLKLLLVVSLFILDRIDIAKILILNYACDIVGNWAVIVRAGHEMRAADIWKRSSRRPLSGITGDMRRFLFSSIGISASDGLLRDLDTTIVGWALSLEAVGIYKMAKNIATLVWRALDPISAVLMPEFTRLAATGNYQRMSAMERQAAVFAFAIATIAFVSAWLFLPVAVPIVLGPEFAGVSKAAVIMLAGLLVGGPLIWVYAFWVATGRLGVQLAANVCAAVVAGILFVYLSLHFGITGAAASFAVAISLPFVLSFGLWKLHGKVVA